MNKFTFLCLFLLVAATLQTGASKGLPTKQYYVIRRDTRKCASPLCGGYWVSQVNKSKQKCHDGKRQAECYIALIHTKKTGLSDEQIDNALNNPDTLLLRGYIKRKSFSGFGKLGKLVVTEMWQGSASATPDLGSYFRVINTGVQCVTTPCPTLKKNKLNKKKFSAVSHIDLSGVDGDLNAANAQLGSDQGIMVIAKTDKQTKSKPYGLKASQYFLLLQPTVACGSRGLADCGSGFFCSFPSTADCGRTDKGGECAVIPQICTKEYAPVCGCDGNTYGNECEAHAAGVSVDYTGACGNVCGGFAGRECSAEQTCVMPAGSCNIADLSGTCQDIPEVCTREYAPVCGCDGQTYSNECEATKAGVNVDYTGACLTIADRVCGGLAGIECGEGYYCQYAVGANCGAADMTGLCEPIPQFCTEQYEPVCGCDGKTYGNACEAAAAGISVAANGECEGQVCSGFIGLKCPTGQTCVIEPHTCGIADVPGKCYTLPEVCPKIYAPVCSCDGKTYSNKCEANKAGATIDYKGECTVTCGGRTGVTCDKGFFCQWDEVDFCGRADATGVCTEIPTICTQEYAPVCGCDGQTYGNECVAHAAGVSVDYTGTCGSICGGFAGRVCGAGQACVIPAGTCNIADLPGSCQDIPEVCTREYAPVCGCDGKTYGNECEAIKAGVSVDYKGACGNVCGGLAGRACSAGQTCVLPAGSCNIADLSGSCQDIPELCTQEYAPVCGCDGKTYGNECLATKAGVSVDFKGECKAQPQMCGGLAGITCSRNSYCSYPLEANCGRADASGVCADIPTICTQEAVPVCGCNGKTYVNRCYAAKEGVSVDYAGVCRVKIN